MSGRFIVIEGIDGCGKTTQIDYLAKWLPTSGLIPKGKILHITREPGGTALGTALRQLLLNCPSENSPEPLTELLLYAADRAQHVSQLILPALKKGDWVISDRFSGSTLAYQGYGRGLNTSLIDQLELIATKGTKADLTIWLDISIEESITRREANMNDRIEAEGTEFLSRVINGFEKISNQRGWVQIAAAQSSEQVSTKIQMAIKQHFSSFNT